MAAGYSREMDRETGPKPPPAGPAASAADAPPRRLAVPGRPAQSGLSADPRLTAWIRRAVVALVVGVGIAIPFGWRWGLSAAAVAAIIDTVIQSKSMAPIPAHAPGHPGPAQDPPQADRPAQLGVRGAERPGHPRQRPGHRSPGDRAVRGVRGGLRAMGPAAAGPGDRRDRQGRALPRPVQPGRTGWPTPAGRPARRPGCSPPSFRSRSRSGPPWPSTARRSSGAWPPCAGSRYSAAAGLRKYFRNQDKVTRGDHLDEEEIGMIYAAAERVLPPVG